MDRVSEVFLLMLNLTQVNEIEICKRVFIEAMNFSFSRLNFRWSEEEEPDAVINILIRAGKINFGYLAVTGEWAEYSREDQVTIRNAVKMFAIILENKFQAQALSERNIELQEVVRENQAILANITATAPLVLYIYDLIKKVNVYANKEITHILGYDADDIRNVDNFLISILHPSDLEIVGTHHGDLLHVPLGEVREVQYRIKDAAGEWHWLLSRDTPYKKDDSGITKQILGCCIDITERIRSEREKEELLNNLRSKNDELESIIYVASHDLRSPLVNIQGFAFELDFTFKEFEQILSTLDIPFEKKAHISSLVNMEMVKDIEYIVQSSNKIDSILKGLLQLSRIGRVTLVIKPQNMRALFEDIISEMQYQLKQAGGKVELRELPDCSCDAVQINQVFTNLIDNAIKYRHPDRPLVILIEGVVEGKYVTYQVKDNGLGFNIIYKDKIFEIFQRLDETGLTTGQGLGLTIVKRIVDRHAGRIGVESAPDQGTCFFISLPASSES